MAGGIQMAQNSTGSTYKIFKYETVKIRILPFLLCLMSESSVVVDVVGDDYAFELCVRKSFHNQCKAVDEEEEN